MTSHKFDQLDRDKVIAVVQKHYGVSLAPILGKRRFLEDLSGRAFWVLGGYENWHGIPVGMFEREEKRPTSGFLVVAMRYKSRIDVFSGDLKKFVDNKHRLSHTKAGDLQFNVRIHNNIMYVNEIDGYSLNKIEDANYTHEEKVSDKNQDIATKIIKRLSHDQRQKLLEQILSGKHNNSQERTE